MKWALWNGLGAMAWIAGLAYARDVGLPDGGLLAAGDHRFLIGVACGLAGVAALLWSNLTSHASS